MGFSKSLIDRCWIIFINRCAIIKFQLMNAVSSTAGASVLQGLRAIKQLLSGAKQVPSDTPPTRQFVKEGGYQQAYKDFATIIRNPKDITVFPTEAKVT